MVLAVFTDLPLETQTVIHAKLSVQLALRASPPAFSLKSCQSEIGLAFVMKLTAQL
jgi:hypothetical protein